jgi:hypothetical protein
MQSSLNQSSPEATAPAAGETFPCPTRRDGAEPLIEQVVTIGMCQGRQRRSYHKCWTCVRRNGAAKAEPAPSLRLAGEKAPARIEAV